MEMVAVTNRGGVFFRSIPVKRFDLVIEYYPRTDALSIATGGTLPSNWTIS